MKEKDKKGDFKIPEEALEKIKSQSELNDFFSDLYKQAVEGMLKAELDDHLGYEKHQTKEKSGDNNRNGTSKKTLKTNIEATVKEIYGIELSEGSVSNITNTIVENIKEWQQRPLEEVYFVVWMDGIVIKIRHNGKVQGKTIYLIIGLRKDGLKEVLGMWISETESASFWMNVLTDLKARGVEDILIACTDNLAGIRQAINAVFPEAVTQLCVVHQIRNSSRYVVWKERKQFIADLKLVYGAINKEAAYDALQEFEKKWGSKYGYAIKSWKDNWEELTAYFDYPMEIRKIIYTTITIENLNSSIRKYIKTKTLFPDDLSATKAVFLAENNIQQKWTMPIRSWGIILNQFVIKFEERCQV